MAMRNHFAEDIVANLDLFLVLVRDLVGVVVPPRLEEEVATLTGAHADEPCDQRRHRRIVEQHPVGNEKADRAHEVQRLVDAAVVIETVIVPPLLTQCLHKAGHCRSPPFDDPN